MHGPNLMDSLYTRLLSPSVKLRGERIILTIAIASYLVHLAMILMSGRGWIRIDSELLGNPIAAIYTPFSFILVYEVYLLIFFLPKSISYYIGKQYEIITLIVIRRIFKDIANLELSSDWFRSAYDLQFTFDAATSLALFALIHLYYRQVAERNPAATGPAQDEQSKRRFISLKRMLAVLLVPMLMVLALYSLSEWILSALSDRTYGMDSFRNINSVFFDEFFTVLIVVDVLLLLASFFYTDEFHHIMRNSGFVISTMLIKVSFSVEGPVNNALILGAVVFGLLIQMVHNRYVKSAHPG
jgi:hypothetical protein